MTWIWLIIILISLIVEVLTQQLVSVWFAAAALVSFIVSIRNGAVALQWILFVVLSFVFMVVIRKYAQKQLTPNFEATNVDRYLGREATVLKVPEKTGKGEVKIDGVEWNAVWEMSDSMVEPGDQVEIVGVEGSKLIVRPK
ncbi:hypothetical protein SDC9_107495 [bioreactor metagenome]|uniref:NfeD-like C-terminal domain-containing protein n=1 Tax=bioreactor metagenome TaxID=1076179 RepID=A0A645BBT4_9ZZZZ